VPRKQCACGCGEWIDGRTRFVDIHHYRRSPEFKAQRHAASLKAKANRDKMRGSMTLKGFGRLTPRELAIYKVGHHNGQSSGYDRGRRKGYADANGEDMEGTWSKARRRRA